ncbi:MAG TPA: hypothetical protein VIZ28_14515 [Chitinophagaceae bacterium]
MKTNNRILIIPFLQALQELIFSSKFDYQSAKQMTQITIDKKKYVIIPKKEYEALQKKAALKTKPEKLLSVDEARAYSKKLIHKWAAGK